MRRCREPDTALRGLNLAFRAVTTLVPPLTTLLGDHPELPRAAVLYGGNLLLVLACEAGCGGACASARQRHSPAPPRRGRRARPLSLAIGDRARGHRRGARGDRAAPLGRLAPWIYLLLIAAGIVRRRAAATR
jgi:hypothetical protein